MNCKEFEKCIPEYIAQKLDYTKLKAFCRHAEECADCREELTIQFLTTEGIQRLEDGGAFDLQHELNQHKEEAKKKIHFHDRCLQAGVVLESIAVCFVLALVAWLLI